MTKVELLNELAAFTEETVKDIILPTKPQKGDTEQILRAADVYKMRLPDGNSATKAVPYIIHQIITGKDRQNEGEYEVSVATIRSIFCVFSADEQEGSLMLLNLMERLRIALLRKGGVGGIFELDLSEGIDYLIYPDETAPFFAGEMISSWYLPRVKREVIL